MGRKKTCNKVIERMYRPGLKNKVIEIVETCDMCQKIKRNFSNAEMLISTPVKPNQIITTEIGGPLKETERSNKYFIVIIDHFTKYVKIYPMKRIQAEDVAEIIVNIWLMTFGIPESILTDGGTNYRSSLMEAAYENMDIKSLRTTQFHPQCNELSEKTF